MSGVFKDFAHNFYDSLQSQFASFARQLPELLLAVLVVAVGMLISVRVALLFRKAISLRTDDHIMVDFLSKAVKIALGACFIMYALKVGGLQAVASGILTAAGASAVIIGFAFRDIGENFISGIILSFNRPFDVGDTVRIGDIFGKINNIEFRYAKLRTFDGKDVYIPNSDVIKKPVFNYTEDGVIRFDFLVGIAYEDEINRARQVILDVLRGHPSVHSDENCQNFVCAEGLGTNTVNLKVHFWIKTFEYGVEAMSVRGDVIADVKTALLAAGHNLPANIVEMKLYQTQAALPLKMDAQAYDH